MRYLLACGFILAAGCHLPEERVVDIAKLDGCEGFDWNGRVTVTKTYKGIFTGYTVDFVKLESADGRAFLLDTRGKGIETYVKTKVEPRAWWTEIERERAIAISLGNRRTVDSYLPRSSP